MINDIRKGAWFVGAMMFFAVFVAWIPLVIWWSIAFYLNQGSIRLGHPWHHHYFSPGLWQAFLVWVLTAIVIAVIAHIKTENETPEQTASREAASRSEFERKLADVKARRAARG